MATDESKVYLTLDNIKQLILTATDELKVYLNPG